MCFDIKVVTCGPNEALIISGVFHGNEPTMIVGGRALVFPMVQTIQKLPLSTMTLVVQSPKVYTSQGVPISVTGVAQVRRAFYLKSSFKFFFGVRGNYYDERKYLC